jgi:hypothetical protein
MRETGLERVDVLAGDDDALWARQRAGQRSATGALVRVAARPSTLAEIIAACGRSGGALVGRAALGISYVELEPRAVQRLRSALPAAARTTVLDAPAELRRELDPWGPVDPQSLALMQRVKERFDGAGVCNPGVFVGGI